MKSKKHLDPSFIELNKSLLSKFNESFSLEWDGVLRYQRRLCVPNMDDLRNKILEKCNGYHYSIHPVSTKMYHDLI